MAVLSGYVESEERFLEIFSGRASDINCGNLDASIGFCHNPSI